jgi:nucleotide-binding universal stress UspA family protein
VKVLLGIDGTEDSLRALPRMIDRAAAAGDDLTIAILDHSGTDHDPDDLYRRASEELEESTIDAPIRRVSGDPGSRLVEIAEEEGFDAIALGGGHRSPMGKITLGGVTEFVILNATVSVILVR